MVSMDERRSRKARQRALPEGTFTRLWNGTWDHIRDTMPAQDLLWAGKTYGDKGDLDEQEAWRKANGRNRAFPDVKPLTVCYVARHYMQLLAQKAAGRGAGTLSWSDKTLHLRGWNGDPHTAFADHSRRVPFDRLIADGTGLAFVPFDASVALAIDEQEIPTRPVLGVVAEGRLVGFLVLSGTLPHVADLAA